MQSASEGEGAAELREETANQVIKGKGKAEGARVPQRETHDSFERKGYFEKSSP